MQDRLIADANARLKSLTEDLSPLSECATRYLRFGVELEGETLLVAPTRWIAPMAQAFWIYEPLDEAQIPSGLEIPSFYRDILFKMNGCFAFDLALFGLPSPTGLLTRTSLRPYSIDLANRDWRYGFAGMEAYFHFGDARLNDAENVGYFHTGECFVAARKNGVIVQTWASVSDLLRDELGRLEKHARAAPAAVTTWGVSWMAL